MFSSKKRNDTINTGTINTIIGDNAKIGPRAMVNKNVEGGEEEW